MIYLVTAHLTVRNVPPKVVAAIRAECRRRGKSLNQTVIDLLAAATGIGEQPMDQNGLQKLAGTWNDEDFTEFEQSQQAVRKIDPELWR